MANSSSGLVARIAALAAVIVIAGVIGKNWILKGETGIDGSEAGASRTETSATDPDVEIDSAERSTEPERTRPPAPVPDDEAALEMPGDVMFRGAWDWKTADGADDGLEEFRITRHGVQIFVDVRRHDPNDDARKMVLYADEDFRVRRAEWTRYGDPRLDARYRREGSALRATIELDGIPEAQEVPFPAGSWIDTGAAAGFLALVLAHDLETGDSTEIPTVRVGLREWRMEEGKSTLSRSEDVVEKTASGQQTEQVYELLSAYPDGDQIARLRIAPGGRLLRMEIESPTGTRIATRSAVTQRRED